MQILSFVSSVVEINNLTDFSCNNQQMSRNKFYEPMWEYSFNGHIFCLPGIRTFVATSFASTKYGTLQFRRRHLLEEGDHLRKCLMNLKYMKRMQARIWCIIVCAGFEEWSICFKKNKRHTPFMIFRQLNQSIRNSIQVMIKFYKKRNRHPLASFHVQSTPKVKFFSPTVLWFNAENVIMVNEEGKQKKKLIQLLKLEFELLTGISL